MEKNIDRGLKYGFVGQLATIGILVDGIVRQDKSLYGTFLQAYVTPIQNQTLQTLVWFASFMAIALAPTISGLYVGGCGESLYRGLLNRIPNYRRKTKERERAKINEGMSYLFG